jgi:hypothetical protein
VCEFKRLFARLQMEDILYVAMGENVKENKSILLWALQNSGGKNICIIHVHQPAKMIPISKYIMHDCIYELYSLYMCVQVPSYQIYRANKYVLRIVCVKF